MHVRKMNINFHQYFFMNMFMITFEEKTWFWYEILPPACIYSLKDFHSVFFDKYRETYPSLLLIEDCCDHFENFIQELESAYENEEFMDDEILDALNENIFTSMRRSWILPWMTSNLSRILQRMTLIFHILKLMIICSSISNIQAIYIYIYMKMLFPTTLHPFIF